MTWQLRESIFSGRAPVAYFDPEILTRNTHRADHRADLPKTQRLTPLSSDFRDERIGSNGDAQYSVQGTQYFSGDPEQSLNVRLRLAVIGLRRSRFAVLRRENQRMAVSAWIRSSWEFLERLAPREEIHSASPGFDHFGG